MDGIQKGVAGKYRPIFAVHTVVSVCVLVLVAGGLLSIYDFTHFWDWVLLWAEVTAILFLSSLLWHLVYIRRHPKDVETSEEQHEPGSTFKTLVAPLPNFQFHHEPYRRESTHGNFFGRKALSAKFLAVLRHSQNSSGSYLVSGYRGVGKTSFVQKVLDDYRNGPTRPGYETRHGMAGGWLLRIYHRLYLGAGWIQLHWHRWLLKLNRVLRAERRPMSPARRLFIGLLRRNAPIRRWWPYLLILGFLWSVKPGKDLEVNLLILSSAFLAGLLTYQYRRFGASAFSLRQWWRWLFRPVLSVQINLGHERLETKRILFDLATLLRLRYRDSLGILSISVWSKLIVLLLAGLFVARLLHTALERESVFTEHNLQSAVFEVYNLEEGDFKGIKKHILLNEEDWEELQLVLKQVVGKTYIGRERFSNALNRAFAKNPKADSRWQDSKYSQVIEDYAYEALHLQPLKIKELCDSLSRNDLEDKKPNLASEDKKPNPASEEMRWIPSPVQSIYCAVHFALIDLSKLVHEYSNSGSSGESTSAPYRNNWFGFTVYETLNAIGFPLKDTGSREGLLPYHLALYFLALLVTFLLYRLVLAIGPGRIMRHLDYIHARIIATDSVEVGFQPSLGLGLRRKRLYEPLDSRQAESLVLAALEENKRMLSIFPKPDIIFVFDELDKINPTRETGEEGANDDREVSPGESVRRRKYEVEQLLSNLKNLVTAAPCRFIFIAGRDMMDAELADQGQVNHLYSSLFEETFYVPSFLTDTSDEDGEDISSMVEQYVCRRLMSRPIAKFLLDRVLKDQDRVSEDQKKREPFHHHQLLDDDYHCWTLPIYFQYLEYVRDCDKTQECKATWAEIGIFIQDFIYYLAYRSSGSPKKLALHFEQFVHPVPPDLFVRGSELSEDAPPISFTHDFILSFDEREQYQVQLISHIFIMLHGETGHLIRQYGDKLSLSTFSILDYLFKFHAVAFGSQDLERMPDVLDIHRAPALPQVIDILLGKTLSPHLRRVDNGLYEYRFVHHFRPEVEYISQFSERDLAAFNFTLDESITIKQHYRELLKRQMRQLEQVQGGISSELTGCVTDHSETLPFLYEILGDLNGLDREFDEALAEYRNALQYLGPALDRMDAAESLERNGVDDIPASQILDLSHSSLRSQSKRSTVSRQDNGEYPVKSSITHLLLYVRILLKMGLIEEQRNQYSTAASRYFQASRAVDLITWGCLGRRFVVSNLTQLTLLTQPMISLAFLHAKRDRLPGISDRIMKRLWEKTAEVFDRRNTDNCREEIAYEIPSQDDLDLIRVALTTRWAEVRGMRSRFFGAAIKYIEAVTKLIQLCDVTDELVPNRSADILRELGLNLSGLADACCAIAAYRYYVSIIDSRQKEFMMPECNGNAVWEAIRDKSNHPKKVLIKEIKSALEGAENLKNDESWKKCLARGDEGTTGSCMENKTAQPEVDKVVCWMASWGPQFYVLSASAFRIVNQPAEAALSLSKLQYFLVFGMGFRELLKVGVSCPSTRRNKISWLLPESWKERCPVEKLSSEAFESCYVSHQKRLKLQLGVPAGNNTLRWIAPPLTQTARVLRAFWRTRMITNGQMDDRLLDESKLRIRDMGAFPIRARILAGFLKGWTYLMEIERRDKQKLDESGTAVLFQRAFLLLVRTAEEGAAYGGGVELLSPPLGVIHYLLWRLLNGRESLARELSKSLRDFEGEKGRFLRIEYCRVRALKLLGDILERHRDEEGFFHFVNRRYYLHDAFSDPYVQGLWAIDYALVPVARWMFSEIENTDATASMSCTI